MDAAASEIPQDLWSEVLWKLPAEDVVKLSCLSKYHRDLINSLGFIKKHNQASVGTTHVITGYQHFDNVVDFSRTNSTHKLIGPLKDRRKVKCELAGSCMGILCYEVPDSDSLILWNPLRKKLSRRVPLQGRKGSCILVHDSVTDDVKVIRISERERDFEIYSSNMNFWIASFSIEEFVGGHSYDYKPPTPVFVQGTNSINWWFRETHILGYNFSTYKFSQFRRPITYENSTNIYSFCTSGMLSLGGCLCLYKSSERDHYLEMWTMKEYGVSKSWTPVFRISHFIDKTFLRPIAFINNASQMVILSYSHGLFLFDMETASVHPTELKKQLDKPFKEQYWWGSNLFLFTPTLREP